ncbi:MAG: hypothetical protein RI957_643 [Verrucomicrobiota bacterium]|jgi:toxin-antitoxin system PIN domain toxin
MSLHIPDANILINAFRKEAPEHQICSDWLRNTSLHGNEIGLCEQVEIAFLRICTLPNIRIAPMREALLFWNEALWRHPNIRRIQPSHSHNPLLSKWITDLDLIGNDVNDAWLAALAMEQNATLISLDRGFARFPGLQWRHPGA